MSDIPKPSIQSLCLGFAQVAKDSGIDVFVILCGQSDSDNKFERLGYVEGDAIKLLSTLADFVREKVPEAHRERFISMLTQADRPVRPRGPEVNFLDQIPSKGKEWMN